MIWIVAELLKDDWNHVWKEIENIKNDLMAEGRR